MNTSNRNSRASQRYLHAALLSLFFVCLTTLRADYVGIQDSAFRKHYRAQQESMWCWASSAEMVLAYRGINLRQDEIVQKVKGILINQGGSVPDMIRSVNGVFNDQNGRQVVVSGQYVMGAPLSNVIYNQLKAGRPIILTYQANQFSGHAVVLTGIDAKIVNNSVVIYHLHIFDPYCYTQSPQPIYNNWGQFMGFAPGPLVKDESLIVKDYPIAADWFNNAFIPGHGQITGMILVDGSIE